MGERGAAAEPRSPSRERAAAAGPGPGSLSTRGTKPSASLVTIKDHVKGRLATGSCCSLAECKQFVHAIVAASEAQVRGHSFHLPQPGHSFPVDGLFVVLVYQCTRPVHIRRSSSLACPLVP